MWFYLIVGIGSPLVLSFALKPFGLANVALGPLYGFVNAFDGVVSCFRTYVSSSGSCWCHCSGASAWVLDASEKHPHMVWVGRCCDAPGTPRRSYCSLDVRHQRLQVSVVTSMCGRQEGNGCGTTPFP